MNEDVQLEINSLPIEKKSLLGLNNDKWSWIMIIGDDRNTNFFKKPINLLTITLSMGWLTPCLNWPSIL